MGITANTFTSHLEGICGVAQGCKQRQWRTCWCKERKKKELERLRSHLNKSGKGSGHDCEKLPLLSDQMVSSHQNHWPKRRLGILSNYVFLGVLSFFSQFGAVNHCLSINEKVTLLSTSDMKEKWEVSGGGEPAVSTSWPCEKALMRWVFSPQQCQCTQRFMGLVPWGALRSVVLLVQILPVSHQHPTERTHPCRAQRTT